VTGGRDQRVPFGASSGNGTRLAAVHDWRIGTSGFSYAGWRGLFYPPDLPTGEWLAFYACEFATVELNVTFYRTPRESTYRGWSVAVPGAFAFVLKAPRLITHIKRLVDCRTSLERFLAPTAPLAGRLALVLLQLPPSLRFDEAVLDGFLEHLPQQFPPLAWEPRHPSFAEPAALAWFRERRQSLVAADSGGRYPTIRAFTAPPAYLRFHGPAALYASPYGEPQLVEWVAWVRQAVPADTTVYAFFNNDAGGHAVTNARQLTALVATSTAAR
jgi:uncharacterized protein YecE (DUF72 family)